MVCCSFVDNFGTGYSNVRLLETIPFTKIKLDRTFVSELATQPSRRVIVRTMTAKTSSPAHSTATPVRRPKLRLRTCNLSYFNPITIESGPTRGSTRVCENPISRIHAWQSSPV
ncbi:EAL domain-containing protein [Phyllobacterium sp. SYP-B3895]|uniref:EAL domain-containing protein n=1 Tax=Phyllobacterium sp. SYP-B3895 TaxID=2663240 RepID=UPI003519F8E8